MKRTSLFLILVGLCVLLTLSAWGQGQTISKIVLTGNDRLTQDAFLALTSLRPGDPYDEAKIRSEYTKIWESGLFEDLKIETRDDPDGVILVFHLTERPIIGTVEYTGSKKLTSTTIMDKLKENKADLKSGTVLDYNKVKHTEAALRFMAAEKGFPDAVVRSEIRSMGRAQVGVIFDVSEGPKARIKKVIFTGNTAFSDRKLKYTMKKTRESWFLSWATRHNIYSEGRYFEDVKGIRELYEAGGYLDVEIGEPIVESELTKNGEKKWLTITIPIEEGAAYLLGNFTFEGNEIFTDEVLQTWVPIKEGEALNKVLLAEVMRYFESRYGEKGYIYATATPIFDRRPDTQIADVSISIAEDEKYFVNRIEFEGNASTRDHVLRREMLVHEREVFNYVRYQRGIYRLKQRSIFEIKEDPVVTKIPETKTVDINVKGTESSKNEFLFGGGYGGINGFFISGSFRTYNFLGLGTTMSLNADVGKVQQLYSVNYSDPWLFGKRIGGSVSLYNSNLEYIQFDQKARGGSFTVTFPIGDFAGWQVGYRYERSEVDNLDPSLLSPTYYVQTSTTSAVFAAVFLNTVNNMFRPTRGVSLSFSTVFAGGPFGGDNEYIKPWFEGTYYVPTFKKQNMAFRLQLGYIKPMNGDEIPLWERFFLGGESSLRGFGIRSVYPLTKDKRFFLDTETFTIQGGDRVFLANFEYIFHIIEQVDLALFIDIGNTYHERQKLDLSNYRANIGIELRFYVPMFQVPLRLIYAKNLKPYEDDDFSSFQFAIALTF